MKVTPANPKDPSCAALLAQSHALMRSMFAEDECHFLDLDALCAGNIRFFAAEQDGVVLGTGALALMDGYAEVKSMFTAPDARGKGVADGVLLHLIQTASDNGYNVMRLETGTGLDAAHRLYRRHGFVSCPPFGSYQANPASLFFERVAPEASL